MRLVSSKPNEHLSGPQLPFARLLLPLPDVSLNQVALPPPCITSFRQVQDVSVRPQGESEASGHAVPQHQVKSSHRSPFSRHLYVQRCPRRRAEIHQWRLGHPGLRAQIQWRLGHPGLRAEIRQ